MASLSFQSLVAGELAIARLKYPEPFMSPIDGLRCAHDELIEALVKALKRRPNGDIMHDLVQVAAMCQRTAEDCKMMEGK